MRDRAGIEQHLRAVMQDVPELRPVLVKLGRRLLRKPELRGQMKLGNGLPEPLKTALLRVLPNDAILIRANDDAVLRLDRIVQDSGEVLAWIEAIFEVTGVREEAENSTDNVSDEALRKMLDRGRLRWPGLRPVWVDWGGRLRDLRSTFRGQSEDSIQRELFALAETITWLDGEHEPIGLMDLSARFFHDSKRLKTKSSLKRLLQRGLLFLRKGMFPEDHDGDLDEALDRVLGDVGVVDNLTASKVTVCGRLVYHKAGREYDWVARLHAVGESATLSLDNLRQIERIELPTDTPVFTCENETPFNQLIRERHPGLIIYTAGYPNSAVRQLLSLLASAVEVVQHWGDSDLDGLRIAAQIHRIVPVQLWRCDLATLQRHRAQLLRVNNQQRTRAEVFLEQHPEFEFRDELQFSLAHGWLEQESWRSIGTGE
ncbi:DUF2399 domain-containing protein [bacterium]|nr:DUF2399 domain-containing protein [bacterium]